MPVALSYPGVYIEEVPSGVRTITGVPTSIAAFVGRAQRGPTNKATLIGGFGEFERLFGGLWTDSQLGFAVRDFFLNGGGQAVIVRLVHAPPPPAEGQPPAEGGATARALALGAIKLVAVSEGKWGANLRASVDVDNLSDDAASALGVTKDKLFNLTVRDMGPGGREERFANLTTAPSARRIDGVLRDESALVRWDPAASLDDVAVAAASDPVTVAADALALAEKTLQNAQLTNPAGTHDAERAAVTEARTKLQQAKDAVLATVSDGTALTALDLIPLGGEDKKLGLYALAEADIFNLLCIPPYRATGTGLDVDTNVIAAATAYCEKRRAMLIIDPPSHWGDKFKALEEFRGAAEKFPLVRSKNTALFFPRVLQQNPLRENRLEEFAPCGVVAGVFARTDTQRGVWKAPAGLDATLVGVDKLEVNLTDSENGDLNKVGINCLRAFPAAGRVIWGSRTLRGDDQLADEWKYIPVRRTALFIEESLYRGTQWVVFEPNDAPLWAQIRLNVGAFLHGMFRQGAFQGTTPRDAYFVKCDKETTTQDDINRGIVNVVVGFAPLKPAEFVVIKLQQMAGQIQA
ncbi:MAG: phage tail sheath subtilisin-like domain-containing protein [Polyangiales bacterium]